MEGLLQQLVRLQEHGLAKQDAILAELKTTQRDAFWDRFRYTPSQATRAGCDETFKTKLVEV